MASVLVLGLLAPTPAMAVNADLGAQIVSDNPANWTPHVVDGSVNDLVELNGMIYAVGTFTTVRQSDGAPDLTRNGIFAFDATTGQIAADFDPNLSGGANSIVTDGTSLYVGGDFNAVNDNTRHRKVAMLDPVTGRPVRKLVSPNSAVNEVVVRGTTLYVGGRFSSVGGDNSSVFVAINTVDGTVIPGLGASFSGQYNGGNTSILRMDLSPDGSKLVVVGNFTSVNGSPRQQVAVLDTTATATTVDSWSTDRFDRSRNSCASVFDTFVRDVDIDPTGSYFVVTATGAFAGGAAAGTLCDTVQRWSLTGGAGQQPEWINYTGGDTTWGVAITGDVVYLGGHFRWSDNPYSNNSAGPGSVAREGLVAVDARNGLPISWNPGRQRGVGAQAMYATPQGLWVGSDTDRINDELRPRIAFLPLAGASMPQVSSAPLGNTVFGSQVMAGSATRLNAGGGAVGDPAGNWLSETGYVSGGTTASRRGNVSYTSSVPAGTPQALFATEHLGNQSWNIPAAAGTQVRLRLYFAEQSTFAWPGSRTFRIAVDGVTKYDSYDVYAQAGGTRRAVMLDIPVTSDGTVNVSLTGNWGNSPILNGIEVVAAGPSDLVRRDLDATGAPTTAAATADSSIDWADVRGATTIGNAIYYGRSDGRFYTRTFDADGVTFGPERQVDLHNDPDDGTPIPFAIASLTGLAYDADTHRLYYTVAGDANLYYRGFTLESEKVGSLTYSQATGINFSTARGLTIAGGKLLYGSTDGSLRAVTFTGGKVSGAPSVVSSDGTWTYRAMFVDPDGPPAPNQAPRAALSVTCDSAGGCTLDASESSDPDGSITGYSWNFGAGATTSITESATVQHSFGQSGTYPVSVTVTDDTGATATATATANVAIVEADSPIAFRAAASAQVNFPSIAVTVPSEVVAGDLLVLNLTQNTAAPVVSGPGVGWTEAGTQVAQSNDLKVTTWYRIADGAQAGQALSLDVGETSKLALDLVAYSGAAGTPVLSWTGRSEDVATAAHATPGATDAAGGWVLSFWADKTSSTTGWTVPTGQVQRTQNIGIGGGRVTTLLSDGAQAEVGAQAGLTAVADAASSKAVMWTMVVS
ncbi:MAG: PKD domain-containing protein [Actinomycetales bacterium]